MDVLLALVGTSPAVLTETVWALALAPEPFLPDSIVVITTTAGRTELKRRLFTEGGWGRLLQALESVRPGAGNRIGFGMAADHIRLLPAPDGEDDLRDITTAEQSASAADCIMRVLREFTEDPGTRVVASIAGGRKTMSALLTSCMVLLARTQDRICHVLVQPPFDAPLLTPIFLFPEKGTVHRLPGDARVYSAAQAMVELVDIPFVRVRGLYATQFRRLPGSYMSLVDRVQGSAPPATNYPHVSVDMTRGVLRIGNTRIALTGMEFALVSVMVRALRRGAPPTSWYDCMDPMRAMQLRGDIPFDVEWFHGGFVERELDPEDFRKTASAIRAKIRRAGFDDIIALSLIPSMRGVPSDGYPPSKLTVFEWSDG